MKSKKITIVITLDGVEILKNEYANTPKNSKILEKLLTKFRTDFLAISDNTHAFKANEAKYKRFIKCGWLNESVPFDFSQPLKLSYTITHI